MHESPQFPKIKSYEVKIFQNFSLLRAHDHSTFPAYKNPIFPRAPNPFKISTLSFLKHFPPEERSLQTTSTSKHSSIIEVQLGPSVPKSPVSGGYCETGWRPAGWKIRIPVTFDTTINRDCFGSEQFRQGQEQRVGKKKTKEGQKRPREGGWRRNWWEGTRVRGGIEVAANKSTLFICVMEQ